MVNCDDESQVLLFCESRAARHVAVVSACTGWSSVCTQSVHSTVCHCARVAQVCIVEALKQLNEHHVIHATKNNTGLNLCSAHLMCEVQVLSRMYFKPLSRSWLRVLTHQQLFKQQFAPWSVASEASTSDPSCWVEFLGPKQHNYQKGRHNITSHNMGKWCVVV